MKSRSPAGIFIFDSKGALHAVEMFQKDPEKALESFQKAEGESTGLIREAFRAEVLKHFSEEELSGFLSRFYILFSREQMSGAIERDKLIIQAGNAFEEVTKISNTLLMRTSEWFSLHYPEIKLSNEKIAESVVEYGAREKWPRFKTSLGVGMSKEDEAMIKEFSRLASESHRQKKLLEDYIKKGMREIAPNISSLMEPLLAARILAAAGSLEKLARLSASSIQLIGAEKALFRHLRKKDKAPKYGMIYTSALLQSLPEEKRGKAARMYAAALMKAARIDYFSGRDESAKLGKELKEELKKVTT